MRVTGTFNNTLSETKKSSATQRRGAPAAGEAQVAPRSNGPKKVSKEIPQQEAMSRSEILRKLEKRHEPKVEEDIAAVKPKDDRPALLVKPSWDDAGEPDFPTPKSVSTASEAQGLAQELSGSKEIKEEAKEAKEVKDVKNVKDEIKSEAKENPKQEDVKNHTLKSDVSLNKPDDPDTQNKLKHVLATGAFKFSDKEKETLKNILGS